MFILFALVAGVLAGLATRGSLEGIGRLSFRWPWLAIIGLAAQVVLFSDAGSRAAGAAAPALYVASTLLVLGFVLANLRLAGMPVVALGALSNLVAILANGGTMPASRAALESAGRASGGGYLNSAELPAPVLAALGDVFAIPSWVPFANVFSVGDVLIAIGIAVVVAVAMRAVAPEPTAPRPEAVSQPGVPAEARQAGVPGAQAPPSAIVPPSAVPQPPSGSGPSDGARVDPGPPGASGG